MIKQLSHILLFLFISLNLVACSNTPTNKNNNNPQSSVGKGNLIDCGKDEHRKKSGCNIN